MIVKAIYEPNFGDITTGNNYASQVKRYPGDIFECDDELAEERIKKGLVKKATKKEEKEYYDSIDTMDNGLDEKESDDQTEENKEKIEDVSTEAASNLEEENEN